MGFFVLLHMHYHGYQNPAWIPTAQLDTDESSVAPLYLPHQLICVMPQVLISHTLRPNGIPISQMCFSSQMGIRWSQSSTWGRNVEEAKVQWYPQKDNVESRDGISLRRKSSLEYLYSSLSPGMQIHWLYMQPPSPIIWSVKNDRTRKHCCDMPLATIFAAINSR